MIALHRDAAIGYGGVQPEASIEPEHKGFRVTAEGDIRRELLRSFYTHRTVCHDDVRYASGYACEGKAIPDRRGRKGSGLKNDAYEPGEGLQKGWEALRGQMGGGLQARPNIPAMHRHFPQLNTHEIVCRPEAKRMVAE